jgi:type IV pilus assembly protein PilX
MLTPAFCRFVQGAPRVRQRGVILMISMIVLVAMTLAGIALVRSVDTSNIIAGNLAFQQAAINAGDVGTETAVTWLQNNVAGNTLQQSIPAQGYVASRQDPAAGQSWDAFWTNTLVPAGQVVTLTQDSSTGNTVSYTIQRMCAQVGDPAVPLTDCAVLQTVGSSAGSSKGSGVIALQYNSQVYYRITSRIVGPRNTVAYVQTIVAL